MKQFTSSKQKTGKLGEDICIKYLLEKEFIIRERNYTKKTGEIDIIAEKNSIIYFIEVKSIITEKEPFVSYETYNPAENITKEKVKKCYKTIQKYLEENNVSYETKFQLDAYLVFINKITKKAYLKTIENIINS